MCIRDSTSETPTEGQRTITFAVTDSGSTDATSLAAEAYVTVTAVNDKPVVTASATPVAFTDTAAAHSASDAVVVASALTVEDRDGDQAVLGATVQITTGYVAGQDALSVGALAKFDVDATTAGQLVFTVKSGESATISDLQAALRQVKFDNTSETPTEGPVSYTHLTLPTTSRV